MPKKEVIFEEEEIRLDNYLKKIYPHYSRELIKKIINAGSIKLNGLLSSPSVRLKKGDKISIDEPSLKHNPQITKIKNMIVYEDEHFMAINKPEGLLVHPLDDNWKRDRDALSYGEDTLVSLVCLEFGRDFCLGDGNIGLVHRLDRETSGLMLIAKNIKFAMAARDLFASREIKKKYLGLVSGALPEDEFLIDAPIGRASGDKRLSVYKYGRQSITLTRTIKKSKKFSYLEISPQTGRTNQIRVHLSHIGSPIVGDKIYGGIECERLMLHSWSLSFIHPFSNKKITIKAQPSASFTKILKEKMLI